MRVNPVSNSISIKQYIGELAVHGHHHFTTNEAKTALGVSADAAKRGDRSFVADIGPLLSPDYEWDLDVMADRVLETLVARLGD